MKFIHEVTGQVIPIRGLKFYYAPWDKWIEDRYLPEYPPDKLARRFGIYRLLEEPYDNIFYKPTGFEDTKNEYVITRTYTLEQRYTLQQIFTARVNECKREGIGLYAKALKIEPILELTGDVMDLMVYKNAIRSAFIDTRNILAGFRDDTNLSEYGRYLAIRGHNFEWPGLPVDEDTWRLYENA